MKQFKTESKRILDLMINSIYTNKEIFIRELISNASDAIDKLHFISLTDSSVDGNFEIKITLNKEMRTFTIEDNGIGMTAAELEKNLGTIAESGTLAFKKANEQELIGQFGVGFYASFMVADKIEVYSKAFGESDANVWTSEGVNGYTIDKTDKETVGTKIVLTLKQDDDDNKYSEYLEQYKVSGLIKQYSDYIHYPIKMDMTKSKKKENSDEYEDYVETETLNTMIPLWKKQKSEVTKENLETFYKDVFHDYETPLKSVYAKIEGSVNYDTLLYIPQKAPYDYYSKDFKKGIKLYCNGVMIMEKCEELLPDYFGFIKGIVDSGDLSLNISREILQQDKQVKAIATSLEKKIVSELKKMLETEREDYDKMFTQFGTSIKFGIYNGFGMKKDLLMDLVLFYSSSKNKLVTLSEYVADMKEDQKNIFYACGDNAEQIKKLPQCERAAELGYEVLYLTENVDEFVVKVLGEYKEKQFKSVQANDFSLDSEEEKKELEEKTEKNKGLTDFMKEALGDKVKAVKLSNRSKQYPACLSSEGEVSIEMEKVFRAMPKTGMPDIKADKILEINVNNVIFEKLNDLFENDKEKLTTYTKVLYTQARMLEGLEVDDVPEFVKQLTEIM